MAPLACASLRKALQKGQVLMLSLDQTDLGNRMAVLMITLRVGDRSLPLAWLAEEGTANIGFAKQQILLEQVRAWVPSGAPVMLLADRFYPSAGLFQWLKDQGWHYRLRLKNNLIVDPGIGDETTTGELAQGVTERYVPNVRLFGQGEILTNVGILHEPGHDEPWIIAMNCLPTRAAVLDYGSRCTLKGIKAIEPTFADFKGRGFELEDSHLEQADRLERLILIMALAMHWCVQIGQEDSLQRPTPLEKKRKRKAILGTGASKNSTVVWFPGLPVDCDT
jgi:hypothetical protein